MSTAEIIIVVLSCVFIVCALVGFAMNISVWTHEIRVSKLQREKLKFDNKCSTRNKSTIKQLNKKFIEMNSGIEEDKLFFFKVHGCGNICMSEYPNWMTALEESGFKFGVEWGDQGYFGGILKRDEAKLMAEFILRKLSEMPEI